MNKANLILTHGIYLNPMIMKYMQNQLKDDYNTYLFGYKSLRSGITENATALYQFITANDIDNPHLIGHSLGGLVIRKTLAMHPTITNNRIVTLGTPHQGSAVARVLQNLSTVILGKAFSGALDGELPRWSAKHQLGSIAGDLPIGVGSFSNLEKPNDGTVTVKETQLEGMTDHLILPFSHTSMLYSKRVCHEVHHFLQHGKFNY